jgi:hypothetical protein
VAISGALAKSADALTSFQKLSRCIGIYIWKGVKMSKLVSSFHPQEFCFTFPFNQYSQRILWMQKSCLLPNLSNRHLWPQIITLQETFLTFWNIGTPVIKRALLNQNYHQMHHCTIARFTLWLTVSRSVCLGVEPIFVNCLTAMVLSYWGAPSLTRGRVCLLSVTV